MTEMRPKEDFREIFTGQRPVPRKRRRFGPAVAIALLLVFALVIWIVYNQAGEDLGGEPPVLAADEGPAKIAPLEPGGLQVPNQGMEIFERMEGQPPATGQSPELMPPPEMPAEATGPSPQAAEAPPEPGHILAPASPQTGQVQPAPSGQLVRPAQPGSQVAVITPPPAAAPPPKATTTSGMRVQLASFPNAGAAERAWSTISQRYSDLLGGLEPAIERADLGDRGVYHRLQAGPLPDRASASALCAKLKAQGQDCIVVSR
jgi:hypothetical protein